jgi:2-amino-4-hydroxy-6-hydroxymethyldihydropteridine diphosphokinase
LRPFAFALGANLDGARAAIEAATRRLDERFGPLVTAPLYVTEPVSPIPQPEFLNTVVCGRTRESPEQLHAFARQLERDLGRQPRPRDAPREIDIDLLYVGELLRTGGGLELPHPRLRERRFVLAPLCDIAGEQALPPDGASAAELLARLPPGPWVERITEGALRLRR